MEDQKTYRCLVKTGHVGSGKYFERCIYIKAANMLEALRIAKHSGGVKKGHYLQSGASVLSVESVIN